MRNVALLAVALTSMACTPPVQPPASVFPNARAAIDRMRATPSCSTGVQTKSQIRYYGENSSVKGDLLVIVSRPDRLRLDVVSQQFGVSLGTLTSNGKHFALLSPQDHAYFEGQPSPCNIARMTRVPVPASALVNLFRGVAPVVEHEAPRASIIWNNRGYYVLDIDGNQARETIHLAPHPDDFGKPWSEQRVRVSFVSVKQQKWVLYQATLDGYEPAQTGKPRVDPDGVEADIPPSGGACDAELPRELYLEVPQESQELTIRHKEATWNPPLPDGLFEQTMPAGMKRVPVTCD